MPDRLLRGMVALTLLLVCGAGRGFTAYAGETLMDPTQPPASAAGTADSSAKRQPQWNLTATIIGPERRVAVINEQALQIGQEIDGARLVAVEPGSVLLLHGNRKKHLKLNPTMVKQTASETP